MRLTPHRPRDMDFRPLGLPNPHIAHGPDFPGVIQPIVKTMQRYEQHIWVVFKNLVSRVPVVDIPVKNEDFLHLCLAQSVIRRDSDVVENTKAFNLVADARVVPRRAEDDKCRVEIRTLGLGHHIDGVDQGFEVGEGNGEGVSCEVGVWKLARGLKAYL